MNTDSSADLYAQARQNISATCAIKHRSLVGMTQGAKKRTAWREAASAPHRFTYGMGLVLYRIGQRLRPCPGCHGCMPGVKGWHIDKVRGRYKVPTTAWCCEGSGVLPAKKAKVK